MNFKNIIPHVSLEEYNTITFNNCDIKVRKYLSTEEKFDLIMTAIQKSLIDGVYNPLRLHVFFNLHIVYLYTDIVFDADDRMNEAYIYDVMMISGLMDAVKAAIDPKEMAELITQFNKTLNAEKAYRTTAASIISKLVDDLPRNVEAAKETVETFDPEKYQQVMEFAKALNGGRSILGQN